MIELEELVHVYPDGTRALDGVDLEIATGERVAIVGQNGSGKSTLVRHFNGLLRPTEGRVLVDGADAATLRVAELAAGRASRSRTRTARSSPVGPGRGRVRAAEPRARAERSCERPSTRRSPPPASTARRATNPYDLGFSRRKLLALASVLAMATPDRRPRRADDRPGRPRHRRVEAIVDELAGEGRTVVAISHDMRFVAESFERVIVMRDGAVVLDGRPDEVFAEPAGSARLDVPRAAARGAGGRALGLGPTPTEALLIERLAARPTPMR